MAAGIEDRGAPDGAVGIGIEIGWPPHRHFDQSGEISRQNGAGGWGLGAPDGAVRTGTGIGIGMRLTVRQLVAGGWFLVPSYKLLATSYLHTSRPAVISTAAQWSGEISLLNGAGRITVE